MKDSIITLIGTNYKYSDLDIRQKLAFDNATLDRYLKQVKKIKHIKEVMILSTCNRVEIITVSDVPVENRIIEFLYNYSGIGRERLVDILYIKRNMSAVRHIFRVASSLDSMVIGEPQILGQIKDAYKWSVEFMTSGAVINRIMRKAFHTAKVVKSRTDIAKGAVSIAYAAMLKAKEMMDLTNKRVLNIGVSEMNRLACEHFSDSGAKIACISNRTLKNARELAEKYGADIVGLDDMPSIIKNIDIIITSTSSKQPVVKKEFIPKDRQLLIIDMAVPRDTEDGMENIESVKLVVLDDLNDVVNSSMRFRQKQAQLAEEIVEDELHGYEEYVESLDYDEVIKELRRTAERVRQIEINKFKKMYKNEIDDNVAEGVERLTHSLLNKVLHDPTRNIKLFMDHPEGDMYIELLKRIFKIEHSKKEIKCFFSENS